ncbi:hypothetical protein GDO86_014902 [Hymenochirus boettgeri]|uniref:Uncharacterized protein n=1 Tax=Hymenochirus boettgeri TaxID=247094 RepID=A0A8T2JTB6_9PIPI|nr:hypothetical protein GDO86_014902 [Hymenochirus boettgeri]
MYGLWTGSGQTQLLPNSTALHNAPSRKTWAADAENSVGNITGRWSCLFQVMPMERYKGLEGFEWRMDPRTRLQTTHRVHGGEQMFIWKIQSIIPDGSSNTS